MTDGTGKARDGARDAAIDWWLRHNDGPLPEKDRATFEAWLAADEANKAAFEKVSRIGGMVATRKPGGKPRRKGRSSKKMAAGVAGALALFIFHDDLSIALRSDYRTGTAETRRVTLDDGSQVELGPRSAIALRTEPGQRRLVLLRGEAWFEAAPDPARPFMVEAANGTVTALGTGFDIALEQDLTRVTVTTHRVRVASGGKTVIVAEGQQSTYGQGLAPQPPEKVDVGQATAWRRGKLIFANKPLGDVVEALARYHHGTIVFADKALRRRPVSGVFKTGDPLAAIDEIESSLGLHTARLTDYLIVLYD